MSRLLESSQERRSYSLCALVLDKNPSLPLSEEEFISLKRARSCINAAFASEEVYDLLINNYKEFELEVVSAAVSEMVSFMHEYEGFFGVRSSINRRLINLLSASRMYLDQYPQHLKEAGGNPQKAKDVCSTIYDDYFEYRFMEALRNHAQHAGLAVHGVTMGSRWQPPRKGRQLQFSVTPYASKLALESFKFKKSVLRESPEKVPLVRAARIHVGGISTVHEKVREIITPLVKDARNLFEQAISRHEAEANKRYIGLAAVAKDGGLIVEKVPIFLDWDDVRQKLIEKNRPAGNLAQRFVTSQSEQEA